MGTGNSDPCYRINNNPQPTTKILKLVTFMRQTAVPVQIYESIQKAILAKQVNTTDININTLFCRKPSETVTVRYHLCELSNRAY